MSTEETQREVVGLIGYLVARENDVLSAVEAARGHLKDARDRTQAVNFAETHRRHLADLDALVVERGGALPVHHDLGRRARTAKVMFGAFAVEDAIVVTMKRDTDVLATETRAALADARWTDHEREVLERLSADDQWHSAWYAQRLGLTPRNSRRIDDAVRGRVLHT